MSIILDALKKKYEAEIEEGKINIKIMLNNPTSIPEHSKFLEELDVHFGKIAEAEDKLEAINNHFDSSQELLNEDVQMALKLQMDKQVQHILLQEVKRQNTTVELIASENFASDDVMRLCGSVFTNKYAEGYPSKRYYNGCEYMDEIEQLAIDELKRTYFCANANVQPHCGANANTAVYQAFLKPGDTILGMDLASGGHLSHGSKPNISGKIYDAHSYGVNEKGWLDLDAIEDQAIKIKPKMIIAGASAYSRQIYWKDFREIADKVGAYLLCDMAHYSGLIAG